MDDHIADVHCYIGYEHNDGRNPYYFLSIIEDEDSVYK
jgi:hypothetical protein